MSKFRSKGKVEPVGRYFLAHMATKQMRLLALFSLMLLTLSGCIFGYVAPAPDGYHGNFVLTRDAQLTECYLGPGIWSDKSGTCIVFDCSSDCSSVSVGTSIEVLHTWVNADDVLDVSVRVGSTGKVAHVYAAWEEFKKYLARR